MMITVSYTAREMGQDVAMEVYGLFAAHIPQHGRAAMRELSSRTRHGLVPDFMMWIRLGRDPVKQYLLELKCAHLSPTWYAPKPWRLQEEAQGKCASWWRSAPRRWPPSTSGRLSTPTRRTAAPPRAPSAQSRRACAPSKKTVPLVFGAFGEASAAVEQLIDALAEAGADVHWRAMKAKKRDNHHHRRSGRRRRVPSCGSFVAGGAWQRSAGTRGSSSIECSSSSMVAARTRRSQRCGDARGARSGVSARLSCLGSVRASGHGPVRGDAVGVSPIEADRA